MQNITVALSPEAFNELMKYTSGDFKDYETFDLKFEGVEGNSPKKTLTQKEYGEQMKTLKCVLCGYISPVEENFLAQLTERFKMDVVFETEHYKVYRKPFNNTFSMKNYYFTNKINFD